MSQQHTLSTSQGILCQGRPGPFWAPGLQPYFCSALQVLFARDASADRASIAHQPPSDTLSASQLSYSRSRVPVYLRVLPVPERVPCEP